MNKKEKEAVRVRIAPSPTGFLHIGTARTALFNYLFAKQLKGKFILRIEDTDKERSQKKYEGSIIESLGWLGLYYDEGPDAGGKHGPYRESGRKKIYQKYIKQLLKKGKAYYCFCSAQKLAKEQRALREQGRPLIYSGKCRSLTDEQIKKNLKQKKSFIVRLKAEEKKVVFTDLLRGRIETSTASFGDFSMAKGFKSPLYNLACVIDDYEMQITHVIRGEDHIPNTPKQILIAKALGINPPQYMHLPLILAPDKSKLSKRHGAVSIMQYKENGYLAEAMVNFLALLGWNPGTSQEIFSLGELIKEFSVKKLQRSGAVFNIQKLDWLNGFYIRKMDLAKLTRLCLPYLIENQLIIPLLKQGEIAAGHPVPFGANDYEIVKNKEKITFTKLQQIVGLYQERLKKLSEIGDLTDYFFKEPKYNKELLRWKKMTGKEIKSSLQSSYRVLENIKEKNWNKEKITHALMREAEKALHPSGVGDRGGLLWPLRVALSGKKASASPFDIAEVLGKEKTLNRIKKAL